MSGTEVLAVAVAAALAGVGIGLLFALQRMTRTVAELRSAVDELRAETVPLVAELGERVDGMADRLPPPPEPPAPPPPVSRVPTALRRGPVVKALALGSGTAHAARRLRSKNGNGNGK
jgi:hypothetical protein